MRAYADDREVATIGGQDSVDPPSLGKRGDRAIDQSESEILELGIELERPDKIRGEGQLVLVASGRVEDFGDQLAHRGPLVAEEVVNFRKHQRRHDDEAR